MHLIYRPARVADFCNFYRAFYPHDQRDEVLEYTVRREWEALVRWPTALSMIIEDLDRAPERRTVGCAQVVFVKEAFVEMLRKGLSPWVCKHVLSPLKDGSSPLMDVRQVRAANAGDGLNGLVTRWFAATQNLDEGEALCVRERLYRSFVFFWHGYNFKSLLVETIGCDSQREAVHAGFQILNDYRDGGGTQHLLPRAPPCLLHMTREKVLEQQGRLINGIFARQPPKYYFGFTLREQTLLRWALTGAEDQEIADLLFVSIWTVRKRWRDIYRRVDDHAPELLPSPTDDERGMVARRRGAGKRSVLLRYLEAHPEDLYAVKTK